MIERTEVLLLPSDEAMIEDARRYYQRITGTGTLAR
jgi:hypothetical protein